MRTVKSALIEGWMKEFSVYWEMKRGQLLFTNKAGQKIMAVCDICNLPLSAMEKDDEKKGSTNDYVELSCPMGHGEILIGLKAKNRKKHGLPPPQKIDVDEGDTFLQ